MERGAGAAGLLTPKPLERLLTDALRRSEAATSLLAIADKVAAAGIEPMSMEDINTEVKAVRAERRQRGQKSSQVPWGPSSTRMR